MRGKTTTRTWLRLRRPDSETRDPEGETRDPEGETRDPAGGVTDRRDQSDRDRDRPKTTLTKYFVVLRFQPTAICGTSFCALVAPLITANLQSSSSTPHRMTDGEWPDWSSWHESRGRARDARWHRDDRVRLQPSEHWQRRSHSHQEEADTGDSDWERLPVYAVPRPDEDRPRLITDFRPLNASASQSWEEVLGDGRDLVRARVMRRPASASADQPGSSDPGSRSGSFGTHDGGHRQPRKP